MIFGVWISWTTLKMDQNALKFLTFFLVAPEHFSKTSWTMWLKRQTPQITTDSQEIIITISKRKRKLLEIDDRKKFVHKNFTDLSSKSDIKGYIIYTSKRENLNETKRNLLKKNEILKSNAIWIDKLLLVLKKCNNKVNSSSMITPIQRSL